MRAPIVSRAYATFCITDAHFAIPAPTHREHQVQEPRVPCVAAVEQPRPQNDE